MLSTLTLFIDMKSRRILTEDFTMIIKNIYTVYFSPTGGTQKIAEALSDDLSQFLHVPSQKIDLTILANRQISYDFDPHSLVILAIPVYAGRIPNKLLPDLEKCLNGSGKTAIIPISVYGNRNYDEALREMLLLAEKHGFIPIGAAAMISQHAFSSHIGKDCPDFSDFESLKDFSSKIAEKILNNRNVTAIAYDRNTPIGPYYTPLKSDHTPARFLKAKPVTDMDKCNNCGICVRKCPMGSISADHVADVFGICIKCQACVKFCPAHAKYFTDADFLSHVEMLEHTYTDRKEAKFLF